MLARRCWFDLKTRFFWTAVLSFYYVVEFFLNHTILIQLDDSGSLSKLNLSGTLERLASRIIQDFPYYIDLVWFEVNTPYFGILAIAISLGGVFSQKNKSSLLITLSLPEKRSNLLMTHAGVAACMTFILMLGSTILMLAVSHIIGKHYPVEEALLKALIAWILCLPFIGMSILAYSVFRGALKTIVVLIVVLVISHTLRIPGLGLLAPFSNPEILEVQLWKMLLIAFGATVVSVVLAIWRFEKNEY